MGEQQRGHGRRLAGLAALLTAVALFGLSVGAASGAQAAPASRIVAQSVSFWSSGWLSIAQGEELLLTHNLGGAPDVYPVIELLFEDTDGGLGINRSSYGGLEVDGAWRGAHWQALTSSTVRVIRQANDEVADRILVNAWVPATPPDFSSPWMAIFAGQTLTFDHNLGVDPQDLTVLLWYRSGARGINHYAYGGLSAGLTTQGAFWHDLTTNSVQVTRFLADTEVEEVHVEVVHGNAPQYDSGWRTVAQGGTLTLNHNLNWAPEMLLVRGECRDTTLLGFGINQLFAGGDERAGLWQGSFIHNLTGTSVSATRYGNDTACDEVRVRISKRAMQVHVPIIMLP